jgi:hypothetical protein
MEDNKQDSFGENKVVYYRSSMAKAMAKYREKMSDEQKAKVNEYQKKKMAERRAKAREEKVNQGYVIKVGRPKKSDEPTHKEMRELIKQLEARILELEAMIN